MRLAQAGNHCQGTLFQDGAQFITPELIERFRQIVLAILIFTSGDLTSATAIPRPSPLGKIAPLSSSMVCSPKALTFMTQAGHCGVPTRPCLPNGIGCSVLDLRPLQGSGVALASGLGRCLCVLFRPHRKHLVGLKGPVRAVFVCQILIIARDQHSRLSALC